MESILDFIDSPSADHSARSQYPLRAVNSRSRRSRPFFQYSNIPSFQLGRSPILLSSIAVCFRSGQAAFFLAGGIKELDYYHQRPYNLSLKISKTKMFTN